MAQIDSQSIKIFQKDQYHTMLLNQNAIKLKVNNKKKQFKIQVYLENSILLNDSQREKS